MIEVLVLTDEGAIKRGRRRWHPGKTIGLILHRITKHDRCWLVRVNGYDVVLFEDEILRIDP